MSIVRRTMMTTAMAMGVLVAAGVGAAGEAMSLVAPQLTIPAAGSTPGAGVFATPNDLGAELTPLPATPRGRSREVPMRSARRCSLSVRTPWRPTAERLGRGCAWPPLVVPRRYAP